ncbi:hypothetical protein NKH34_21010 [Mesorhizobium sp. M1148]|uniref:HTH domain-containing protein n=1 Tax=unclassified Mesorhizobium TaxID=325217 RepID=UPI0033357399
MAGYRPTQIRKPSDETDFEKKCVVLFKELLNDPNVSRVGTRGQGQNGVDIKGLRDRNPHQIVGVQCKLKSENRKLTKKELDDEVKKALAFTPLLSEYFIVATSKNDTKLQQHALKIMQTQEASGRKIHVEVWGWDTLQEKIDQYESAKQAFDPGFSPALAAQDQKLDALIDGQSRLPTKEDLAALAKHLEKDGLELPVRLPPKIADRELREEFSRALRRRGFQRTDIRSELTNLAKRAIDGDLVLGSASLKADICVRAARASATPETYEAALRFRTHAADFNPSLDLFVVDALLKEAVGDKDAALRDLKSRSDIDTRSALFFVIIRLRGADAALKWARSESLSAVDFTPPSALNLVLTMMEDGDFETALSFVLELPPSYFEEIAVLHLLRAQLTLASILPNDQKTALFEGLPINPRQLQFANSPNANNLKKTALSDIQALLSQTDELGIEFLSDYLSELSLFLQLEISDFHDVARARLVAEIADPKTTLRRVRLALAYDVSFNAEALQRNLARQKELGGWTTDERFAAFLIAFHSGDAKTISNFFDTHRDDLFTQSDLKHSYLAAIEIETLARSGRFDDARRLIAQPREHLTDEQIKDAEDMVAAIENDDEVERHRKRYEQSGSLLELRILVGELRARQDTNSLAIYAPVLARATLRREDFDVALKSLYQTHRDVELIDLANELPDLAELDLDYQAIKGWSLYRLGRVMEARGVARGLLAARSDGSDRELAINTNIETGDWGNLQAILAHEVGRIDALSAMDCVRLARLALEISSPYVDRFRDAAIEKAPDNPEVYLAAYMLATERGEEDQGSQAHNWLEKAAALSGPEGPVQSVSFREMMDLGSGWRERTEKFDKALKQAEIPVFMIARAIRRRLLDLTLGQARRNLDVQDRRVSYPVFAFSGAKADIELGPAMTAALDVTAVITLEYLGLLSDALTYFQRIVIAPRTLSFLFGERQFVRVQQPSEVAKAQRMQALISGGRIKIVPRTNQYQRVVGREVGEDLATILDQAKSQGGLVVRSAPVTKLGSYLEETADLSGYSSVLTDIHSVLKFLSSTGKIDAASRRSAETYLRHVDKGWSNAPEINQNSKLYLDGLAVTYLDHAGLLAVLIRSAGDIFIHEDVNAQTQQTLRYSEHTQELLSSIERIRSAVAAGVENGRVTFSARRPSNEPPNEDGEDPTDFSPTLDLLSDLTGVDVAIADDRCLNKLPNWVDPSRQTARCATTLDILTALRVARKLDDEAYWLARHKLRAGGFYSMSREIDELSYHLAVTPVVDGVIRETPELRAIRESLLLPQIHDAFIASEEPWFIRLRFTIYKAIRRAWIEASNAKTAEARANWLLSILPNPLEWCLEPDNVAVWAASRQQAAIQVAIFMVFTEGNKDRKRQYFKWVDENIVGPNSRKNKEIWDISLEFLKTYVKQLWDVDDG